jgi:hypothetical protein
MNPSSFRVYTNTISGLLSSSLHLLSIVSLIFELDVYQRPDQESCVFSLLQDVCNYLLTILWIKSLSTCNTVIKAFFIVFQFSIVMYSFADFCKLDSAKFPLDLFHHEFYVVFISKARYFLRPITFPKPGERIAFVIIFPSLLFIH